MKFKNKIGSIVVLTRKNKSEVFLVKRSDFPVWESQGGGIEKDETPEQCAVREAYEETGFKVKIVRKVAVYKDSKSGAIDSHVFEGSVASGQYIREYPKCEGKWFNTKKLPVQMTAARRKMIKDCLVNNNKVLDDYSIPFYSIQNFHLLFIMPAQSIKFIFKYLFSLS